MIRASYYVAAAWVVASSSVMGQTSGYFLDRVPTVPATKSFTPQGITDTGIVAGTTVPTAGGQRAVSINGTAINILPGMGGNHAAVNNVITLAGVNSAGAAAGHGYNASNFSRAIYWDVNGSPWELIPFGDRFADNSSEATDISENNWVVGVSDVGDEFYSTRAMIWKSGYTSDMHALQSCDPVVYDTFAYDRANAISPDGTHIVGICSLPMLSTAVVWSADGSIATYLENDAFFYKWDIPYAAAINNDGYAVGNASPLCDIDHVTDTGECYIRHGYLWDSSGTATDLGVLPKIGSSSYATSINNANVVVGSSYINNDTAQRAVLWNAKHAIIDLNQLMAAQLPAHTYLAEARKITDQGRILTRAKNSQTGTETYYQLTPIVPTTLKITSNINPSSYGQQIHLIVTLQHAAGTPIPQGNVNWYDNGRLVYQAAGITKIGTASWEPATLAPGKHQVTVTYGGYSPNGAASSAVFTQTLTVASTKTSLIASAASITHGKTVKLVATVTPTFGAITGTVTFKAGSSVLGSAAVNSTTKQATLSPVLKTAGKYSITATYGASTNFAKSTSAAVTVIAK